MEITVNNSHKALASDNTRWRQPMRLILVGADENVDDDDMDSEVGYVMTKADFDNVLSSFKEQGYKSKRVGGATTFIADKKQGGKGIYAEVHGNKIHLNWSDRPDEDDEDYESESSASQYPWAAAAVKDIKQALPAFKADEFFDEGYELRGPKMEDGAKLAVKVAKAMKQAGYHVVRGNSGGDGYTYAIKIEGGHAVVIEPTAEVFEDGAYIMTPYVKESDLDWEGTPKALASAGQPVELIGMASSVDLHDFMATAARMGTYTYVFDKVIEGSKSKDGENRYQFHWATNPKMVVAFYMHPTRAWVVGLEYPTKSMPLTGATARAAGEAFIEFLSKNSKPKKGDKMVFKAPMDPGIKSFEAGMTANDIPGNKSKLGTGNKSIIENALKQAARIRAEHAAEQAAAKPAKTVRTPVKSIKPKASSAGSEKIAKDLLAQIRANVYKTENPNMNGILKFMLATRALSKLLAKAGKRATSIDDLSPANSAKVLNALKAAAKIKPNKKPVKNPDSLERNEKAAIVVMRNLSRSRNLLKGLRTADDLNGLSYTFGAIQQHLELANALWSGEKRRITKSAHMDTSVREYLPQKVFNFVNRYID